MAEWIRALRRFGAPATPVAVCMLAGIYLLVGDRTVWGEWLTIWPPALWGGLFLVRALLVWLEGHRRLATIIAGLAVLFVLATTELASVIRRPDSSLVSRFDRLRASARRHDDETVALRVVSWNVSGMAPLAELESLDPDMCLFQEIGAVAAARKASTYWTAFHWFTGLDPGTMTRFPAEEVPSATVGPWTPPQLLVVTLPNGRRLLVANVRLVLPSIVVSIASLGDFGSTGRGHAARLAQFPRLASLVRAAAERHRADAILLGGDFNTPGNMPSLDPIKPLLRDAWMEGGTGWGGSMTADMPVSRIDQCWVSRDIAVVRAWVQRGKTSDHRMLVVDLLVGPPGPARAAQNVVRRFSLTARRSSY